MNKLIGILMLMWIGVVGAEELQVYEVSGYIKPGTLVCKDGELINNIVLLMSSLR